MGYDLHISRPSGDSISEEEWRAAVAAVPGLRMSTGADRVLKNPNTGAEIRIKARVNDVDFLFPNSQEYGVNAGKWVSVLRFSPSGRASIKAAFDLDDASDPVRAMCTELAHRLGAVVSGDDGEVYDW